jgi:hypothetical protein
MIINNSRELEEAIQALEQKKITQEKELVEQFHATVESFKPGNLIRSSLGKLGKSELLGPVLKTAGSLGLGLLTNKLMGGAVVAKGAGNVFSSLLRQQAGRAVINNFDKIKAYGAAIYKNMFTKK